VEGRLDGHARLAIGCGLLLEEVFVTRNAAAVSLSAVIAAVLLLPLAGRAAPPSRRASAGSAPAGKAAGANPEQARRFIEDAEKHLLDLVNREQQASWVHENFITDDTEAMSARAREQLIAATTKYALEARRFEGLKLPAETSRKIRLLKLSLSLPAPNNPAERSELTEIVTWLESTYGKGRYCPKGPGQDCLNLEQLSRTMSESRDPAKLLEAWTGWHTISPPMRPKFERFVALANKGAREMGFADVGAMWRSKYDMTPAEFTADVERLWQQVRPLYLSLHAYVRASLAKTYGAKLVPEDGPIPAHLLGNMWAQSWINIYPLVAPPSSDTGFDLTAILHARKVSDLDMVRDGERFFTSLGFDPLPKTFWERSLFRKPADRDVVCHASAWDLDAETDLRIKMCIETNDEDFSTIHHELGHNFYQRAYRSQPPLFRDGANDGFHEAIGDTIALSITPAYLKEIGLLEKNAAPGGDIGLLMKMALDKVAFLPFGLLIDQWRWKVFSGEVKPADYNKAWWDLRLKYQGVAPPVARTESDFDPGAKYHVPANVSYTRYFLAHILQFQFHRALCREAGYTGPLHLCSIYDNKAAGKKLATMLEMGQSRPWPEALEAVTGQRQVDASALLEYFEPLKKWLDEQNKGRKVGF
jgi:peptidyl-dipeptidase A